MPTEPTIIRRYTPPTCTLEIAAQQSPLSRWMGKIALKDLRFKLSFDDPRVSDDRWITLRGDSNQLEELSEVVNNYVQSFLNQSGASGNNFGGSTLLAAPTSTTVSGIALQPKGLLSHQLLLGSLATAESGDAIALSSTQLADLATALDEHGAAATSLPKLERATWIKQPKNWAAMAAGLLVAVGLSTSVLKGLDKSATQTASNPTASSSDQRLSVPPPSSPTPNLPTLGNSPLASLPPGQIPPIGTTTPGQPNIVGALPSPSPNSSSSTSNAPTIGNNPAATNSTAGNKPEVVSIPQPSKPNISEIKPDAMPKSPVLKPDAAVVSPIPNQLEGAELLKKQRALEETAPSPASATASARGALGDAPAPEPPGAGKFAQADALKQVVQQGWKKPDAPLSGSMEYRVRINADGTLGNVEAVTDQAQQFQGNNGIPALGSQVAPRSSDGKPSNIRLNLGTDGVVNAAPE